MKYFILILTLLILSASDALAQRELKMSQYMHNRYSINPAFGGAHESLSMYGSYRKKWLGFDASPSGALFTLSSPLKKENVALGAQFFNDKFGVSQNTGFNLSYAYRLKLNEHTKLAFGISGGMVNYKSNWTDVILSSDKTDPHFANIEQTVAPWVSFGAAIYHTKYFAGLSLPSLLYHDRYQTGESSLDFAKIDYLLTAGYMYHLNANIMLQPSMLLRINPNEETFVDISATAVAMNAFILGASYRTSNQIIGIVGYQITPQFRFSYSLDYDIDPIGTYNNGTHEVALQINFGYKTNSPDPKFF
ncbi:type IX secretion system membrane protein, PorP/SprF family [Saccharicrinis carchari]|uniref:Type IX secretion system membrane protein, PorP/SprF family n=1 Tax=Saccharicrinis carchari TaxID=1168039 RepID=A0A521BV38_SACCC|nr:PorP/SprF family type IX secretion system membrane protein [Saccharicrinis carchari]SMO51018.1 type IX secretion system membrane protein, PorP/SprF family [Saccharicrinis carchari]